MALSRSDWLVIIVLLLIIIAVYVILRVTPLTSAQTTGAL